MLIPFYIFAWITSLSYAGIVIISKYLIKYRIQNQWLFLYLWYTVILCLTAPIAIISGAGIPSKWSLILLISIFITLGDIGYVLVLKKLDVTVMSPLYNLRVIPSAILAGFFLGETYNLMQYLFMAFVVLGAMLVTLDEKMNPKSFLQIGTLLMILTVTASSIMSIFLNKSLNYNGYWTTILWMGVCEQILLLPLFLKSRHDLANIHGKSYTWLIILGILGLIGLLSQSAAFEKNVTISSIIVSLPLSMVLAMLISFFKPELLEKHTRKVYALRLIGAIIMFTAAMSLTLG